MIRVEDIHIKEFRGIRDFKLTLKQKNFAVCGPNGTGKSGIVDALEFALTGDISRLQGVGTGDISVKDHGPHVDSRNNPEKAEVSLTVFIPSLNQTVSLTRNVKAPKKLILNPDTTEARAVLDQVALHPEISLSRREIIKYVLAEPGKRSKEVQALLRLDDVEKLRGTLQKVSNAAGRDAKAAEQVKAKDTLELERAMGISRAGLKEVTDAANEKRKILNLPLIEALTSQTSLTDGLHTQNRATEQTTKVVKEVALRDLEGALLDLNYFSSEDFIALYKAVLYELSYFDDKNIDNTTKEDLLQKALTVFDESCCPVCDTEWDAEAFRNKISEKLKAYEEITAKRKATQEKLSTVEAAIERSKASLRTAYRIGNSLIPAIGVQSIADHGIWLTNMNQKLVAFAPINSTRQALYELCSSAVATIANVKLIEDAVKKLPDASVQDAAREYLITAQLRLSNLRDSSLRHKKLKDDADKAQTVFELYVIETNKALENIYKDVEQSFMELYKYLNSDEQEFQAALRPSNGKLGFDVDFYGRGFFPPGAYHSEGHQDSMGLCLYLSLMKHLLGANFTFSVLDDVLMSVDSGHRRDVSKMLQEKFPDTQFVLTTHDEVWLKLMKTVGLVGSKSFVQFRKWTVDNGPIEWEDRDVWKEIEDLTNGGNVRAASALLRNYLEHVSAEICSNLRAKVEFKGDHGFTLGDLLPNAISALSSAFKKGKDAAQSWCKTEVFDAIETLSNNFKSAVVATNVEQWQVNASVHYNEWASLHPNDFRPVVKAYKQLLTFFTCDTCHSLMYLVYNNYNPETLRCACMKSNIDFVKKQKASDAPVLN